MEEFRRILAKGHPGPGAEEVLRHTVEEAELGKFEGPRTAALDSDGNIVSDIPWFRRGEPFLPMRRFPAVQGDRGTTS